MLRPYQKKMHGYFQTAKLLPFFINSRIAETVSKEFRLCLATDSFLAMTKEHIEIVYQRPYP